MPELRLQFQPGVDVEKSPTANRGGWVSANLIRFREGYPEKLRGWVAVLTTPVSGLCRALHYFTDPIGGTVRIGIGTTSHLQVAIAQTRAGTGLTLNDITPAGYQPGPVSSGTIPYSLRIWSLDNWGTSLIAIPSGGPVYVWSPSASGLVNPATIVANAPALNQGGFVAMPFQILMVFGATPFGNPPPPNATQDAMLVRWSDQGDYTDWTPSATNQAGSYRLPRGNRIIGAKQTPLGILIWTDIDLWMAQYLGFPLVWGFDEISANCGLLAENAAAILGSSVYWMSDHGFFQMSGAGVQQMPCPVWDFVYLDIDEGNWDKCFAATDYQFSELFFFFPSLSGGTGEIDSYVKYNTAENIWDTGRLVRTAWTDQNRPGPPLGIDQGGLIQQHDTGFDNNGQPMSGVSIRSGYLDMGDGAQIQFVDRFIPDQIFGNSPGITPSYQITLLFRLFPDDTPQVAGPYTITPSTKYISLRLRAREVAIELDLNALGSWVRLGVPRLRIAPDGRY